MQANNEVRPPVRVVDVDLGLPGHSTAVLRLLSQYARDQMGGGNDLPESTKSRILPELRKREDYFGVLAFAGDDCVGLINCFEGFSTFQARPLMNIHDVFVVSGQRGRGISTLLLRRVEEEAKARGCCKMTLEVLEGNKAAQAIYGRHGFHPYTLSQDLGRALFWEKELPLSDVMEDC